MSPDIWSGVLPAITTPFDSEGGVDHGAVEAHVGWLVEAGCGSVIPCGSLGEGATLSFAEKVELVGSCVRGVDGRAAVIPGIAALATEDAVALARCAEELGCGGLMVLPPYVHKGSWREMRAHFEAVLGATALPCMLYNNPVAYGVDVTPPQLVELAAGFDNLVALKESSGDSRRITAVRAALGDRLALCAGLDDMVVEAVAMGAGGWVAGLVNALPEASVALFEHARAGRAREAFELYSWFLPLLRLDTEPSFVQSIKLVQQLLGRGSAKVRAPRLALEEGEVERVERLVAAAMASAPILP
jgi:1-pyrroline-4-hydroxy-2-carboxylate deaminase